MHTREVVATGSRRLSRQLGLASAGAAVAVAVVCAVGLFSLGNASAVARVTVERQLKFGHDTAAMARLFYSKGFVAEYLLTGGRHWLEDLESSRATFSAWLAGAHASVLGNEGRALVEDVREEYGAFDAIRQQAILLHDSGRIEEAKLVLDGNRLHASRLRDLFERLDALSRADATKRAADAEGLIRRLALLLVVTSVGGAVAASCMGFFWARWITKPIDQLEVVIDAAAERTRIKVDRSRGGLALLTEQVAAIAARFEETDAALAEHRRRLVQSEKLSAIGEIATKLAHEVLNPLAGIKAAVQLFARHPNGREAAQANLVAAVDREVNRVDALLRRLMRFSRPLAPRFQVVSPTAIVDGACESATPDLARHGARLERHDEPGLPPLEADPLLLGGAITNLIKNAAEALAREGGRVWVRTGKRRLHGRDEIVIEVIDEGRGLSPEVERQLFKPFVTSKTEGHGLGLALSQNIVFEHGGVIRARNRPLQEGPGAHFEMCLPLVR